MSDISALSNEELRNELKSLGVNLGPIVGTTRTLYEKKLAKLRKEPSSAKPKQATPSKPKTAPPKAATPAKKASSRRNVSRTETETEESQEDSDSEQPAPATPSSGPRRPLSSSPKKVDESFSRVEHRKSSGSSKPANSIIPGLRSNLPLPSQEKKKSITSTFTSTSFSSNTTFGGDSDGGLNTTGSRYSSSAHTPSQLRTKAERDRFDRPGATPPRTAAASSASRRTVTSTSSVYNSPSSTTASRYLSNTPLLKGRGLGDLGHTTDEDDQDGEESSRIIYSSSRSSGTGSNTPAYRRNEPTQPEKTSPIVKLWNRAFGSEGRNEFKVGDRPATLYDLRMGNTRTRFERDARTGRVHVDHKTNEASWWDEVPRLLIIVLSIFFVILAIGYLATAHKEMLTATSQVISATVRDTIEFCVSKFLVPIIVLAAVSALATAAFFGHKYWASLKEKEEEAMFDLVEKITDMVRDSASDGDEFISVPHVRDVLFPPAMRKPTEMARWERAVEYINENESRVATETRLVRGHECAVWKWLAPKRTGWQGKGGLAF